MTGIYQIEGYAIVSEDGMLADATGVMPGSLKFEADYAFFETFTLVRPRSDGRRWHPRG